MFGSVEDFPTAEVLTSEFTEFRCVIYPEGAGDVSAGLTFAFHLDSFPEFS